MSKSQSVHANSLFKLAKILVDNAQDDHDIQKGIEKFNEAIQRVIALSYWLLLPE